MSVIDFSRPGKIGFFIDGITHLAPAEALDMVRQGVIIVDLREDYETNFRVFGVDNVIYLPKNKFMEDHACLPKDKPLILTDAIGLWSKEAIRILQGAGYSNLANLVGGIIDWERAGLPVCKDKNYELSGQCSCKLKPRIGGNPLKKRENGGIRD